MRHHTRRSVRCVADGHKLKFAREQRREPTQSEQRLWQHLRRHGLGLPFRRQHPIGDFVLDFYCAPARLAVEIDGPTHEQQREYDQWRDAELAERGIRMLRISDDEVRSDISGVLERIRAELEEV
jgi:very-short-patch-repair endonuclease